MKESGIDWIGQIPEEWEVSRLKYFFDIYAGGDIDERNTVDEYSENHPYPVISNSLENEGILGYTNNFRFQGDSVTVTGRGDVGKAVYRNIEFYPVVRLLVCIPKKQVDCRFVTYWINSAIIEKNQTAVSQLTIQMLGELIFTKVPYVEQKKIADFLDKKTAQLDKVKALLEEQIQKLKDYSASLIYETVTKGLDKNALMKDSGVDWIGQVPEGWGVKPLKYLIKFKNGYAFDSKLLTMEQTGVKVIRIGDFKSSGIDFNAALNVFTSFNSKLDFYRIRKSQILIAMSGATVGKISFVNQEPNVYSVINQRVGIIESEINKWIYYCLSTDSFTSYIQLNSNGSAQPNISSSEISDFKVGIPDDVVIQKCVKYLDKQLESINKLIQIKNQQIENINKQRQSLIYDYVTGKRRV